MEKHDKRLRLTISRACAQKVELTPDSHALAVFLGIDVIEYSSTFSSLLGSKIKATTELLGRPPLPLPSETSHFREAPRHDRASTLVRLAVITNPFADINLRQQSAERLSELGSLVRDSIPRLKSVLFECHAPSPLAKSCKARYARFKCTLLESLAIIGGESAFQALSDYADLLLEPKDLLESSNELRVACGNALLAFGSRGKERAESLLSPDMLSVLTHQAPQRIWQYIRQSWEISKQDLIERRNLEKGVFKLHANRHHINREFASASLLARLQEIVTEETEANSTRIKAAVLLGKFDLSALQCAYRSTCKALLMDEIKEECVRLHFALTEIIRKAKADIDTEGQEALRVLLVSKQHRRATIAMLCKMNLLHMLLEGEVYNLVLDDKVELEMFLTALRAQGDTRGLDLLNSLSARPISFWKRWRESSESISQRLLAKKVLEIDQATAQKMLTSTAVEVSAQLIDVN